MLEVVAVPQQTSLKARIMFLKGWVCLSTVFHLELDHELGNPFIFDHMFVEWTVHV